MWQCGPVSILHIDEASGRLAARTIAETCRWTGCLPQLDSRNPFLFQASRQWLGRWPRTPRDLTMRRLPALLRVTHGLLTLEQVAFSYRSYAAKTPSQSISG